MAEKCPNCGMDIEENDLKCKNCGKQLKVSRLTEEELAQILQKHSQPAGFDPKLLTAVEFSDFWKSLSEKLKELTLIRNWTADKGYYGEDFKAKFNTMKNSVDVYLPLRRESLHASYDDFKIVYNKWNDYIRGTVNRNAFSISQRTKYVISIIHHITITT